MNSNIKISIIVPVYNVEKYLERCLNSLINQTLKEIEIICVNDGSEDNSREILERYKNLDNRIIVIDQENQGLSVARNSGMEKAKGEYLGFVDSDDWVDLDYFEKLYNEAKFQDADIASSGIIRLHKYHKKFHLKFDSIETSTEVNKKLQLMDFPDKNYVWNKIYRTEKLKTFNLKFIPGIIYEDVLFTLYCAYYMGKFVTVPGTYYYYWRRPDSLVKQKSDKAKHDLENVQKQVKEFCKEHNINISAQEVKYKRYTILGVPVLKIKEKSGIREYRIFNIIKWTTKNHRGAV